MKKKYRYFKEYDKEEPNSYRFIDEYKYNGTEYVYYKFKSVKNNCWILSDEQPNLETATENIISNMKWDKNATAVYEEIAEDEVFIHLL